MAGIAKAVLSPIGAALGLFGKPKAQAAPKPVVPVPVVDQSAALDAATAQTADDLRRRRGAAANELTGSGGAEATTPGAKTLLGQ